jgi:hypothetical protein
MFLPITGLAFLTVSFLSLAGRVRPTPFDGYTTTATIPWVDGHQNFVPEPHVRIKFSYTDGTEITMGTLKFTVDTGTCGIVTTENRTGIQDWEKTERAWHYLSSSHVLYTGWWVERDVTFAEATSNNVRTHVRSRVKVLSIGRKYTDCTGWTPDQEDCEENPDAVLCCRDPDAAIEANPETSLLGIGYGRVYDSQPQGTPNKNPLLNLRQIGSSDLAAGFYPGWRIDEEGMKIGLTNNVWGGMSSFEVPLGHPPLKTPSIPPAGGPRPQFPWRELNLAHADITVNLIGVDFQLLFDTGLNYSSIRLPEADALAVRDTNKHLKDEIPVRLRVGRSISRPTGQRIGGWQYGPERPSSDCDITPEWTQVTYDSDKPLFINTGRHIFRRWAQGYDPWRGIIGFEEHPLLVSCPP